MEKSHKILFSTSHYVAPFSLDIIHSDLWVSPITMDIGTMFTLLINFLD